jgi:hypothetical protein
MRGQNSNDEGCAKDLQIVDSMTRWEALRFHGERSFPAYPLSSRRLSAEGPWGYDFWRPPAVQRSLNPWRTVLRSYLRMPNQFFTGWPATQLGTVNPRQSDATRSRFPWSRHIPCNECGLVCLVQNPRQTGLVWPKWVVPIEGAQGECAISREQDYLPGSAKMDLGSIMCTPLFPSTSSVMCKSAATLASI